MAEGIVCGARISGVYKITNTASGKFYIGSSVDVRGRMYRHRSHLAQGIHKNAHLQAAFRRDGESTFSVAILEECAKERLLEREQFYIDALKPEYNILPVAGSSIGYKHDAKTRAKMTESQKGNKNFLGKRHSAETRRKLSELASRRRWTEDRRAKHSEAMRGNKHTQGRALGDEHRSKVAAASKQMWAEPGRREQRSADTKALWADPVWKAMQLAKIAAGKAARRAARGVE